MSAQMNPYAPPQAAVADVSGADAHAEAIREEHIKHEASIRSVGGLYYLGGGLMLLAALTFGALGALGPERALVYVFAAVYLGLGILSVTVGRGLRAFEPWARTASIVLAAIGLLGFPLGTLINGYILYLLLSKKGKRIFEPDYPQIVAATPHLIYRTSWVVWLVLGLLILAVVAVVVVGLQQR